MNKLKNEPEAAREGRGAATLLGVFFIQTDFCWSLQQWWQFQLKEPRREHSVILREHTT